MLRILTALLILSVFLNSCTGNSNLETKKNGIIKVTVSILPQAFIVKSIGGEHVSVNVMVPPASSPETYEPGPKRMAELRDSDIYFSIGVPFEMTSIDKIKNDYTNVKFVDMQAGIELRDMESHHGHNSVVENELAGEIKDPHIWLDPVALIQMSQNTVNEFIRLDPSNRDEYIENHLKLTKQLQLLNDEMVDLFKDSGKKAFIIYHPAWGYFANRYRLRQIPVEIEGKEPSASEMAQLTDIIKKYHIKYIFMQAQTPETVLKSISAETGAEIETLDPLKENVIENIRDSALMIKKGLVYAKRNS
ncbi:MAG TPA: zinc ABC transporter substrate-binding protein [bacterium]|nr:zinc ABC transporter substrate-binding protein [bacterium]HPS29277.1 zinc ABC transporter substrate-binding protein [bacterium]